MKYYHFVSTDQFGSPEYEGGLLLLRVPSLDQISMAKEGSPFVIIKGLDITPLTRTLFEGVMYRVCIADKMLP